MPILNLLPRENMLFGTEGIELYKSGNYIDSHGAYPNGTSYDFTTRISFNASTGRITFQYHADVTGGVTIEKGGLTVTAGKIVVPNNTLHTIGDDVEIGDGNIGGCLVIHGLNAATGISFKPYSGSTEQRITTNGSGTMNISGNLAVGGNVTANNAQEFYINRTVANHTAGYAQVYLRVIDQAQSSDQSNGYIRLYSDGATGGYGANMVINTGGSVTIGGGESPQGIYDAIGVANTEECLRLTADGNVYVYVNANTVSNRIQHTFYSNGEFHVSDTNLGRKVRDVLSQYSNGTTVASNYILVRRG